MPPPDDDARMSFDEISTVVRRSEDLMQQSRVSEALQLAVAGLPVISQALAQCTAPVMDIMLGTFAAAAQRKGGAAVKSLASDASRCVDEAQRLLRAASTAIAVVSRAVGVAEKRIRTGGAEPPEPARQPRTPSRAVARPRRNRTVPPRRTRTPQSHSPTSQASDRLGSALESAAQFWRGLLSSIDLGGGHRSAGDSPEPPSTPTSRWRMLITEHWQYGDPASTLELRRCEKSWLAANSRRLRDVVVIEERLGVLAASADHPLHSVLAAFSRHVAGMLTSAPRIRSGLPGSTRISEELAASVRESTVSFRMALAEHIHRLWEQSAPDEDAARMRHCIASALTAETEAAVAQGWHLAYREQDAALAEKLTSWRTEHSGWQAEAVRETSERLRTVFDGRSLESKCARLLDAVTCLHGTLEAALPKVGDDDAAVGAEVAFPVLVDSVVHAAPPRLVSTAAFLSAYSPAGILRDSRGWAVTTLEAAVAHLLSRQTGPVP
eukprot:TRINITY_DN39643_c0_g1_i1.p1 TRINITY_DN39643_c0_g1~~TRINITY_DN39643_c0_g1_i1.p1  ORF type:complete len:495 (+),score=154.67 TRINITY_DN39643_c0_g1_i1:59-1543(+)